MDVSKLDELARRVGGFGCVIKDGYLVYSWGDPTQDQDWFSASKPVLSTLLLIAVAEGKLPSVDAPLAPYWPLSSKDQTMTFRHLADMTGGYARPEKPGQAWSYNDYGIMLYVRSLEKVFHQTLEEALQQRLGALDFQDGRVFSDMDSYQGGRIQTSARDFARIGWLWLNKGRWKDRQLIPSELFEKYCRPDVPADLPRGEGDRPRRDYMHLGTYGGGVNQTQWGPGIYGFNWWFNARVPGKDLPSWPDAPPDTYQANGRWGADVMTLFPSLNMVVAAEGEWGEVEPGQRDSRMNQNLKLPVEAARGPSTQPAP